MNQFSLSKRFLPRILQYCVQERGSAVVEFVVLALPLFVPLVLFVNGFATKSFSEISYQNIARQSLRAFVTSPDFETGVRRIEYIISTSEIIPIPRYIISCPIDKCFTPGSIVTIELLGAIKSDAVSDGSSNLDSNKVLAKLSERFDQWRDS